MQKVLTAIFTRIANRLFNTSYRRRQRNNGTMIDCKLYFEIFGEIRERRHCGTRNGWTAGECGLKAKRRVSVDFYDRGVWALQFFGELRCSKHG